MRFSGLVSLVLTITAVLVNCHSAEEIPLGIAQEAQRLAGAGGAVGGLIVHVGPGDGRLTAALSSGGRFLVHGLIADREKLDEVRSYLTEQGIYGQVTLEPWHGGALPFVDDMVNYLVVEEQGQLSTGEMMRVLVPGDKGYIGTVLTPLLVAAGHEVRGLDSDFYENSTFGEGLPSTPSLRKDIRDVTVADLAGFDAVVHLAGLSNDPLYLGVREPRLQDSEYMEFMEEFVDAVFATYPDVLLQWEDFSRQKAWSVLERFRDSTCSFNDDIQGTGAVTYAGILASCKLTGSSIANQKFCVYGAGAGGGGIIEVIVSGLERAGLSDYIDARLADAHELVPALPGPFDFVFVDADKNWYTQYFRDLLPKLEVGGCFTAHNVSTRARGRRGRRGGGTGDFVDVLMSVLNLETEFVTRGGGLSVSYKPKLNKSFDYSFPVEATTPALGQVIELPPEASDWTGDLFGAQALWQTFVTSDRTLGGRATERLSTVFPSRDSLQHWQA